MLSNFILFVIWLLLVLLSYGWKIECIFIIFYLCLLKPINEPHLSQFKLSVSDKKPIEVECFG